MRLAIGNISNKIKSMIPPKQWYHEPELRCSSKKTTAMWLALHGIVPPKEWEHEPTLQDVNGVTVAMYLAGNGIVPPK